MSLLRTGLRLTIRTVAPPLVLFYILYKFYEQIKDVPWFVNMVETYGKLYRKLRKQDQALDESD